MNIISCMFPTREGELNLGIEKAASRSGLQTTRAQYYTHILLAPSGLQ